MQDRYGSTIEVGDTVKVTTPSGGVLPPPPPVTGIVVDGLPWEPNAGLAVRYRNPHRNFDEYVLLLGRINEIDLT